MSEAAGQRRPLDEDLEPLLELIWEGKSLRQACLKLGLHVPSTSDWLHADTSAGGRGEQYARAREGRAEYLAEDGVAMNRAAALGITVDGHKIDAAGARGYLEAVKWQTARMAPKTAPVQRLELGGQVAVNGGISGLLAAVMHGADGEGGASADEG